MGSLIQSWQSKDHWREWCSIIRLINGAWCHEVFASWYRKQSNESTSCVWSFSTRQVLRSFEEYQLFVAFVGINQYLPFFIFLQDQYSREDPSIQSSYPLTMSSESPNIMTVPKYAPPPIPPAMGIRAQPNMVSTPHYNTDGEYLLKQTFVLLTHF